MESFAKIVNGLKLLTIFTKYSTLDTQLSSEYASVPETYTCSFTGMLVLFQLRIYTDIAIISTLKRSRNIRPSLRIKTAFMNTFDL